MTRRTIVYARVSDPKQEKMYGLDYQERICRERALALGDVVVDVVCEQHTGTELEQRVRLGEVRRRLRAGEADVLLVFKFDRLGRKQAQQAYTIYELERFGIKVESATEILEDTPIGAFMRNVYLFVSEQEHVNILERTSEGRQQRALAGKHSGGGRGGRPTYGYTWAVSPDGSVLHDRLDSNPATAPIVVRIFEEVARGVRPLALCRQLAREGVPAPGGGAVWYTTTIRDVLLNNSTYWGKPVAMHYRVENLKGVGPNGEPVTQRVVRSVEGVPLPADMAPALVSQALAEQARAAVQERKVFKSQFGAETYLLRGGFLRCGYCGRTMVTEPIHHTPNYMCASKKYPVDSGLCEVRCNHIRQYLIDAPVWEFCERALRQPGRLAAALQASLQAGLPDAALLKERLGQVQHQQNRAAAAILALDDESASAPLLAQMRLLGAEAAELQALVANAAEQQAQRAAVEQRIAHLQEWCDEMAQTPLDYTQKRLVLQTLGLQVRVWKKGHEPRYEIQLRPVEVGGIPYSTAYTCPPTFVTFTAAAALTAFLP